MHADTGEGDRYMEYVNERGIHADLPFDELMAAVATTYPGLIERLSAGP